jgi:hypothetical protein
MLEPVYGEELGPELGEALRRVLGDELGVAELAQHLESRLGRRWDSISGRSSYQGWA